MNLMWSHSYIFNVKKVSSDFVHQGTMHNCRVSSLSRTNPVSLFHLHFLFISRIHEDHRRLHLSSNTEQGSHVFLWVAQAFWNQGGSRDAKEGGITLLGVAKESFLSTKCGPPKMTRCFFFPWALLQKLFVRTFGLLLLCQCLFISTN